MTVALLLLYLSAILGFGLAGRHPLVFPLAAVLALIGLICNLADFGGSV